MKQYFIKPFVLLFLLTSCTTSQKQANVAAKTYKKNEVSEAWLSQPLPPLATPAQEIEEAEETGETPVRDIASAKTNPKDEDQFFTKKISDKSKEKATRRAKLLNFRNKMKAPPHSSKLKETRRNILSKLKNVSEIHQSTNKSRKTTTKTKNITRSSPPKFSFSMSDGWVWHSVYLSFPYTSYYNNMWQRFYQYYGTYDTSYIVVGFDYVDLDYSNDYVAIYDQYGGVCDTVTGTQNLSQDSDGGFNSNTCTGNSVDIWIKTDSIYSGDTYDGFGIKGFWEYTESSYSPPVAIGSASSYSVEVGQSVYLDGSNSYDDDGDIASYYWTFGDGSYSTSVSPTHQYSETGIYTVTLKVTDSRGYYSYDDFTVEVYEALPSLTVTLETPSVSTSNPARIVLSEGSGVDYVEISWGDNSSYTYSYVENTRYEHKYKKAGTYLLTVYAQNDRGTTKISGWITVTGTEIAPSLSLVNETEINSNQQSLTYVVTPKYSVSDDGQVSNLYVWFSGGDPDVYSGPFNANSTQVDFSHNYSPVAGVYNVTSQVWDNTNVTSEHNFVFTTKNQAPKLAYQPKMKCKKTNCSFYFPTGKLASELFTDVDGSIQDYYWDFYKSNKKTTVPGCVRTTDLNTSCDFKKKGTYYAKFTVKDNLGKSKDTFLKVEIKK